jgi:hypothetical protein
MSVITKGATQAKAKTTAVTVRRQLNTVKACAAIKMVQLNAKRNENEKRKLHRSPFHSSFDALQFFNNKNRCEHKSADNC